MRREKVDTVDYMNVWKNSRVISSLIKRISIDRMKSGVWLFD